MSLLAADWGKRLSSRKTPRTHSPLLMYWLLFCGSVLAFDLEFLLGDSLPTFRWVLTILSSVTCGFAWLLSRELFRGERRMGQWPHIIVAALFVNGLIFMFWKESLSQHAFLFGALDNLHTMLASVVLFMIVLEPIEGLTKKLDVAERRFRLTFIFGQSALLLVCIAWFQRASEVPELQAYVDPSKVACALLAVALYGWAVHRRLKSLRREQIAAEKTSASSDLLEIADQMSTLIHEAHCHRNHTLRVSDLSDMLDHPDYKVTQAITQVLSFPNFNQWVNHHRVEDAKRRLSDPECAKEPILTIALDCGFGSIGPFNRAFKSKVGMTPTAFRAQSNA